MPRLAVTSEYGDVDVPVASIPVEAGSPGLQGAGRSDCSVALPRSRAIIQSRLGRQAGSWHSCSVDRSNDIDYLRSVERLANEVCDRALEEGWLTYLPDDYEQSPLQRSINELARNLRHVHFDGDGCLEAMDD